MYNRTDVALKRAQRLRILTSLDGVEYDLVFAREDDQPFGGLNGHPLSVNFTKPLRARFVRLTIIETNFFHLNQVEIFGHLYAEGDTFNHDR